MWSYILGCCIGVTLCALWASWGVFRARKKNDPLASTVIRYEGTLENKKMRVLFETGDGVEHSMLIDRHVAQKMSDDLLIGVARIDTMKAGEGAP